MDNKTKNMKLLGRIIVICVLIIIVIASFTILDFNKGYYREWISMLIGLFGSLAGGVLTMLGVVWTLNRSEDEKTEKKKKEIKKLSFIINNEFNQYIKSANECLSIYKYNLYQEMIYQDNTDENGECLFQYVKQHKPYEMISNIKDLIYELILLSDDTSSYQELLDFYNAYKNQLESFEGENRTIIISDIFDRSYKKLIEIDNNSIKEDSNGVEHYFCFSREDIEYLKSLGNAPFKLNESTINALAFLKSNLN